MYHIYQTKGWVLGGLDTGEANRFIEIFTAEFGLVRAMAQGVRHLKSKLRYGLQNYSYVNVSLVKGRQFWRVTGVERLGGLKRFYEDKKIFRLFCRIFDLVRRLVKGEEKDANIFLDVERATEFVENNSLVDDQISALEIILVFRLLHKLGYVGHDSRLNYLAEFTDWDVDLLHLDGSTRAVLLQQINTSLAHSHL